ncbi:hypothetical protein BCV69DRAFT_296114 [Microstroma glucosiphilum]|uniref:Acyltransferase MbtK/IucB-like conserved domain-containing protein n=1 Tax=Pseudomicrostroma glucosiphilum TaxID=1684307 RepID=A0A316UHJ0_9BASI|nr:hypothetical protein BCV69DRAFT_296114 [Pseudomicrostroma glucosiphilum]PWN23801.1 hypothetical protein BCV69DRAFT_296114 [Pseudomicrostroma glucosiphilum]
MSASASLPAPPPASVPASLSARSIQPVPLRKPSQSPARSSTTFSQSHIASTAVIDELLPHWRKSREQDPSARPSLYHDASQPTKSPLFSRRIDWLPSPNVLHYVPISLSPEIAASGSSSSHLKLFTRWQSDERVSAWWNQAWSEEEQRKFLAEVQDKDDSLGLVGYWSDSIEELGEPWGYVELYWAKTSSIRDFYDYPQFTLGFHALVGENRFRGPDRVRAWMGSAVYLAFALEERCNLVVSEPNIKNQKMVDYECECGGVVEKPIDLPHKRAALVFFHKDTFQKLWPIGGRQALGRE